MPVKEIKNSTKQTSITALGVIRQSIGVVMKHPQILIYPYTALLLVALTYPLVSASIFATWYDQIFSEASTVAPHRLSIILGFVGFLTFYTAFIAAYFSTAVSAAVLAVMDGKNPTLFFGVGQVSKHFFRVTKFALLAVFFFPMGMYAQRRKLRKSFGWVLGSSLTLHMAQIAPSILEGNQKYGITIRNSIDRMGKTWKEGLILKIGMYSTFFLIAVLPKLTHHHWYLSQTTNNIGWLIGLELGASGYVFFKVTNAIFTAVLYHRAMENN